MNVSKLEFQEQGEIEKCSICQGEIYNGTIYYCVGGEAFHKECLVEFAKIYFKEFEGLKKERYPEGR